MWFENEQLSDAFKGPLRRGALDDPWLRAHEIPLCRPPTEDRREPDRRPSEPGPWWRRIAAAISRGMAYIATGFADAAAGMYPELLGPLAEHVDHRDPTREPPPDPRVRERG